jgi:hypothetical protein
VGEQGTFFGHAVYVWGPVAGGTGYAQVAVAHIIQVYHNYIGGLALGQQVHGQQAQQQGSYQWAHFVLFTRVFFKLSAIGKMSSISKNQMYILHG